MCRYKGIKEGGVLENSSYFLFIQKPDKSFDAIPVDEWYSFTPIVKYNFLSAEEAELEYNRYIISFNHVFKLEVLIMYLNYKF